MEKTPELFDRAAYVPETPIEAAARGVVGRLVCRFCGAARPAHRWTCDVCHAGGRRDDEGMPR